MKAKRFLYAIARVADHVSALGKRDAVFIWVPKTAGTSLYDALKKSGCRKFKKLEAVTGKFSQKGLVTFGHLSYAELVASGVVSKRFDENSFKFSFSRNPFARAASLYFYSRKYSLIDEGAKFIDCLELLKQVGCPRVGLYNHQGMSQWNPQTAWLEGVNMDFVGQVETISEDYIELQRQLGLRPATIKVLNRSQTQDYRNIYDAKSIELVRQIYRSDFERFEYSERL